MTTTHGVSNPALFFTREPFEVTGGNRLHARFLGQDGRPLFFTQHRRSCMEAALFEGRTKIGQVTEEQLELREVRVHSDKLYSTPLFSSHRRWKGPDGVKYSWQATQEGDLKLLDSKTNTLHVYVDRQNLKATRLILSSQVAPFVELVLLTLLQAEFEWLKKHQRRQQEEDDKDQELGVW